MHGAMWRALETEQSRQPNKAALGKPRDLSPGPDLPLPPRQRSTLPPPQQQRFDVTKPQVNATAAREDTSTDDAEFAGRFRVAETLN
jgi:hypothetical protein